MEREGEELAVAARDSVSEAERDGEAVSERLAVVDAEVEADGEAEAATLRVGEGESVTLCEPVPLSELDGEPLSVRHPVCPAR